MAALNTITLPKTYAFSSAVERDRDDDWGPELWKFLDANIDFEVDVAPLRNIELARVIRERFINHVLARLVVAGCYATEGLDNPSTRRYERLEEAVDLVVDADDFFKGRVVWFLDRICGRILGKKAALEPNEVHRIRKFAAAHSHRCYLCGRVLHYKVAPFGADDTPDIDKIREKRTFEIEHVWCQARGGSKARANLAASCNDCNKVKSDALSSADFPLERYLWVATSDDSVRIAVNNQVRVALYWKQNGACAICNVAFYNKDSEAQYLVHREPDQPLHFFNLMVCCEDCNAGKQLNGVKIR